MAIQALAGSETVSALAARHAVSRKFVYQQTRKARTALDGAFSPAVSDSAVLFELTVTKAWLRQVIVGLPLICRSSYRGVVEFVRDLLGVSVSIDCVHDVLEAATRQASAINCRGDCESPRTCELKFPQGDATAWPTGRAAAGAQDVLLAWRMDAGGSTWGTRDDSGTSP